jgi:hypothetical protein
MIGEAQDIVTPSMIIEPGAESEEPNTAPTEPPTIKKT